MANEQFIPKEGEKVIWDSNSGYDIAEFVGESPAYNNYTIKLKTGRFPTAKASVSKNQVKPYSQMLMDELATKYNYYHSEL